MTITSNDDMIITIDGEPFVDSSVQMELIPCGLDFVCPESIDLSLIPKIYQRPKRHRDFIAAKVK